MQQLYWSLVEAFFVPFLELNYKQQVPVDFLNLDCL